MNTETAQPSAKGLRVSILIKCLLILSAATFAVAGVLTFNANRMSQDLTLSAMELLATDVTELTADGMAGAVRFGKTDDIQATISSLLETHPDKISSILVMDGESNTLASAGEPVGPDLACLATAAIQTASLESTGNGLWVAVPVAIANDGTAAGALAIAWTDAHAIAELRHASFKNFTIAGAVFLVAMLGAGAFFHFSLAAPLARVAKRTAQMTQGDLVASVTDQSRRDEIGVLSRELDNLRAQLHTAEGVTQDALFKSAGFQGSSTSLTMTDMSLNLTHYNAAFGNFISKTAPDLFKKGNQRTEDLLGAPLIEILNDNGVVHHMITQGTFPIVRDLRLGHQIIALKINLVTNDEAENIGYILEWEDITLSGTNGAIISALEADQMRADFDSDAKLKSVNAKMKDAFAGALSTTNAITLDTLIKPTSTSAPLVETASGRSVFDKFEVSNAGKMCVVSGSLTPILDRDGKTTGYVFLGEDITKTELARKDAMEANAALEQAQRLVVDTLSAALTALSQGDLSVRLETKFTDDYETLRSHFNESIQALDEALSLVLDNSSAILGEAGNISGAADDLSRRTEQQAATLEQFAAALTEITASVASAADGASKASGVVTDARKNAEASGSVVREAVEAMGEIASSSEQISRIISVIDDIAFQTNLLALNAGVEAARAGDAGRGFAVVASEVRALAQRSSEAAREISTLISTSGNQVKKGVSLVDKAGEALTEIVTSVGDIEDHVTGIAASAREQSTGLEEINTAISQLDQVTQQNVAMFEETTAATHTLTAEANALVSTTSKFRTTGARQADNYPQASGSRSVRSENPATRKKETPPRSNSGTGRPSGVIDGALAIANDDDDWEDF